MTGHEVKGWCPGALRPMMSGDGLVVRVRPFGGRLRRAQADGIASLAAAHGNGFLDVSSRGNIQIRGVSEARYSALIEGLSAMGLIDPTPEVETRRNILVCPFWKPEDETEVLAAMLTDALAADDAPDLPSKFGFAIDTCDAPVLQDASADIRLEYSATGDLILVADGMKTGRPVSTKTAATAAIELAKWFMAKANGHSRMKHLIASGLEPAGASIPRQSEIFTPKPGYSETGALVGMAFGQIRVETLSTLAKHGAIRLTPWRMFLIEGATDLSDVDGVITDPSDPLLRISACTGSPACPQALNETRSTGRTLAKHIGAQQSLHISGCTKGCAHPADAPITIVAESGGYALIRDGNAGDVPDYSGLSTADLKDHV
ncbi:precorrin-3B synthase [Sulfitobacter donghicola]|uniref:Precorrin-3B synthase n=1 Tax=Sulfitobacter donghicola DSW-25 = KCTC 12864 = JCM 14565 TaxID=1300350 RepID=A0A073IYT3_9RHOB|nr:precorrin-3B synthase [Sulfitobacter donghicola]KEJ90517.1 precorrin-3B synthase [Sulfitobacter donghicola DSW-25 = KCTC 12864 = JCM 14565]KIN67759.1 Precorrin-3B synthase [Sulfitobacter donghicola DSW-25 = KCTC 12864 = JCM 14565]